VPPDPLGNIPRALEQAREDVIENKVPRFSRLCTSKRSGLAAHPTHPSAATSSTYQAFPDSGCACCRPFALDYATDAHGWRCIADQVDGPRVQAP
jgi:hypothetical protein